MRLTRWQRLAFIPIIALFFLYLYSPFVIMLILSFQVGPEGGPQFPLQGLSLYWYKHLFGLTPPSRVAPLPIWEAFGRSLVLGVSALVVSTAIGFMTALAFRRGFRGSNLLFYAILLGAAIPGILLGLGASSVARALGFQSKWYTVGLLMHLVYTLPFAFVILLATLNRLDRSLEEASYALGANPWQTFRRVTLPLVSLGVLSSMLFSFTLSYDEYSRSLLTVGTDLTLPLAIYGTFATEIHPNLFAFGVLSTVFSLLVVLAYWIAVRPQLRRFRRASGVREEV
jgi:putative spermidine/putrescine transport system permease protein